MTGKQADKLRGLLTDIPDLSAQVIEEIVDIINRKERAHVDLQSGQRKKICREVVKDVLSQEKVTYEQIEVRLGDHLPESFTKVEKEEILSDPDKALDVFVDMVCQKVEDVQPK